MNRNIYRLLKILHLIGLSLFLGSIFGHIVASVLGGAPEAGNEAAFLASRVHITAATRYLTMPGLLLTLATGVGMWLQSWSLKRDVWLRRVGGWLPEGRGGPAVRRVVFRSGCLKVRLSGG